MSVLYHMLRYLSEENVRWHDVFVLEMANVMVVDIGMRMDIFCRIWETVWVGVDKADTSNRCLQVFLLERKYGKINGAKKLHSWFMAILQILYEEQ